MISVAVGIITVGQLVGFAALWLVHRRIQELPESGRSLSDALGEIAETLAGTVRDVADVAQAVDSFAEWRGDIIIAVDEGIREVKRREDRINRTVSRARKELEAHGYEHAGLEAEASELRLVDGGRGEDSGVPPMYEDVGAPYEEAESSSVPGVSPEQLRRARGF